MASRQADLLVSADYWMSCCTTPAAPEHVWQFIQMTEHDSW